MAIYACIKPVEGSSDYIVSNVIIAEPSFVEGSSEHVLIEEGVIAGIGFTYSGGVFTAPVNTDWEPVRLERDRLLALSDFAITPDYFAGLSEEDQASLLAYRQALRDVPQNADLPDKTDWPRPPAFLNL